MEKKHILRNSNDLKLEKQRLNYDIKLREEAFKLELLKMQSSFVDSLKTTARIYSQKLVILFLSRFLRSKFKLR